MNEYIKVGDKEYRRIPIKTRVIQDTDDIAEIVAEYTEGKLEGGDVVVISEKCVSITQKRWIHIDDVKPSRLAKFLCKYVHRNPGGVGLSIPETMEMAIEEAGRPKIIMAAIASALSKKILRRKGDFYRILGQRVRSIDGPDYSGKHPFSYRKIVLAANDVDAVCERVRDKINHDCVVVDVCDQGGNVIGISNKDLDQRLLLDILKDNPLGQMEEQTPIGIIKLSSPR